MPGSGSDGEILDLDSAKRSGPGFGKKARIRPVSN
jgi:hypothetical protein